ncbi:uncharacterized protein LOC6032108 [Culex quinquefasciatus]|uniref:uncharacterized protein LOC6032108 n=1 Tax=Culex quinquefasciatus TaxID=7176 RepID=UPI0018E389EE|nr:uncharacterized protein LOC6032108 [Culex quinquefasciatus]
MPKRKLLTDSGIQPKQPKIEIRLPPEIWQKIFLNLPLKDLIVARLTCHRWRDAVGSSPGLRDKFWLKFPHDRNITMINRNYKPPGTVPASNVMFQLDNYSKIGSIAAWWPQVASTVTCLVMCGCEFPVDVLGHAPNLKSLDLISARFRRTGRVNFKLINLRRLSLKKSRPGPLACLITRLEELEFAIVDEEDGEIDEIVGLIQSAKSSLKELVLDVPQGCLRKLSLLTELNLKKVKLRDSYGYCYGFFEAIVQFVEAHPAIEELSLFNPLELHHVLRALPNLKRLFLGFSDPHVEHEGGYLPEENVLPEIPNVALSNLEHLQIDGNAGTAGRPTLLIQQGARLPKLKQLYLGSVFIPDDSLSELLRHSPDLRSMTLTICGFDSWHQLLSLITQPKRLQRLSFSVSNVFTVEDDPFNCPAPVTSLTYLKVGAPGNVPSDKLRTVFRLFPAVTELQLQDAAYDGGFIEEMCRSLAQLERLSVNGLGVSCEATTHLRQYCHKLRYLRLYESWAIPPEDIAYFSKRLDNFYYNRINSSGEDSDLLGILEILKQLSDELSVLLNYC